MPQADRAHSYSGQVFRGSWSKTEIALKVLKAESGVSPRNDVRYASTTVITFFTTLLQAIVHEVKVRDKDVLVVPQASHFSV